MQTTTEHQTLLVLESLVDKVIAMRASAERNSVLLPKKWRFLTLKRMFLLTAIAATLLSFLLSIQDLSFMYQNLPVSKRNHYFIRLRSGFGLFEMHDGFGADDSRISGWKLYR